MFWKLVYFVILLSSLTAANDITCSDTQWECRDGSCIWIENKCDGKLNCPDGSDETQANCQNIEETKARCILPPYPGHGTYRANVEGKPGDAHYYLNVNVSCHDGYKVKGAPSVHCYNGWWPEQIAECVYAGECGVLFRNDRERSGEKPTKRLQMPWHVDFYATSKDYQHVCGGSLIRDDTVLSVASCFWIVNIERSKALSLKRVSVNERVAVAGNKKRAWNGSDNSRQSQQRELKQIHLANYITDSENNVDSNDYLTWVENLKMNEIALVILANPFIYNAFIRPVCIDFNINFERRQLQAGIKGKMGGWGLYKSQVESTDFTPTFEVIDLSFVDSDTCIVQTKELLRKFNLIPESDRRICTEYKDGNLFHCRNGLADSIVGSGLVYPEQESEGVERFYLRGIMWKLGNQFEYNGTCKPVEGYEVFIKIQNYEKFVKKFFNPEHVVDKSSQTEHKCVLPPYPARGKYISNIRNAKPGEAYDAISINVTCKERYVVNGPHFIVCFGGKWSSQIPQCAPQCRLPPNPAVEYRCLVSLGVMDGFRACNEYELSDTLVSPICRTHYYSATVLKFMHCIDGEWYNIPKCTPECGTLTPNGTELAIGGKPAQVGEVPWHAGIYTKTTRPYKLICGGSLISNTIVISAAHCFWDNLAGKLPASNFAVAVGKLYRRWDSTLDPAQHFDVQELHMPARFQGSAANFQDDIALVVLNSTVKYETYIRPVCIHFDINFERRQLQPQNKGKVAGWGLTAENDHVGSQVLRVVELPYVDIETCIRESPASFLAHITSDKICAGFSNAGMAVCKGDSGGGLAFPELDKGTLRYYLRGVVSTAPTNDNLCNANTYTSFTRLITHQHLITRFWRD